MLDIFTLNYLQKRKKALSNLREEEIKKRLWQIKSKAVKNLKKLQKQAIKSLEANGVNVYQAETNQKAGSLLKELIAEAKLVVKAKSNTIKEIFGSRFPISGSVIETDIGDFLAQMMEKDSGHPVLPSLGVSIKKIKNAMSVNSQDNLKLKIDKLKTADELVELFSSYIRKQIYKAEVGLTGANAITAEGQIVILENEGNISLVTRIPEKHIVIAGIEKIVPTIEDALHICRCAAIWGTGQSWPSYINIISGPSKTADINNQLVIGAQGAKEVHLILVDDWRSDFIGGDFEEMLYCINCGACLDTCPVFISSGVVIKILDSEKNFYCTTCSACSLNCPAKIDWQRLTLKAREREQKAGKIPAQAKEMLKNVKRYGNPFGKSAGKKFPQKLYCC